MIKGRKVYDPLTDTLSTGYWAADDKGNYYPVWQKGAVMERLTEKDQYSQDYKIQAKNLNSHCVAKDKKGYVTYYGQHIDKLAEYEDLEEQGLLLRLPCKVGDKAWYVNRAGINEVIVDSFVFNVNLFANVSVYIGAERFGKTLTPYKTLFFSKEEAEQKLKEMESE